MAAIIDSVQTQVLSLPIWAVQPRHPFLGQRTRFVTLLTRVRTKDGIEGFGYFFAETEAQIRGVQSIAQALGERIVGMDAMRRTGIYDLMWNLCFEVLREGAANLAMSTIDTALWDIFGKAVNLPLSEVFGQRRDSVEAYGSHGLGRGTDLAGLEADCAKLLKEGFKGVKVRFRGDNMAGDVERARVVRNCVGADVRIFSDALWALTPRYAEELGDRILEYGLVWLEDPLVEDDVANLKWLRDRSKVPIASGERLSRLSQLDALLDGVDHVILETQHLGGITPFMKAAAVTELRNIPLSGHASYEIHLPLLAALKNPGYLEYVPAMDVLYKEPPKLVEGRYQVSNKPGLGLELDEAGIAKLVLA